DVMHLDNLYQKHLTISQNKYFDTTDITSSNRSSSFILDWETTRIPVPFCGQFKKSFVIITKSD
ncbi:Hypothetical predicted protein, partial [Mytilus galloprovincialis]